jgi:hypothetical protein
MTTSWEAMEQMKEAAIEAARYESSDKPHQTIVNQIWQDEMVVAFALERIMQGFDYVPPIDHD